MKGLGAGGSRVTAVTAIPLTFGDNCGELGLSPGTVLTILLYI
jgi:hypothetical protein